MRRTVLYLIILLFIIGFLIYLFKDLIFISKNNSSNSGDVIEEVIDWDKYFEEETFDLDNYTSIDINQTSIIDRFSFPEGLESEIVYKIGKMLLGEKEYEVYFLQNKGTISEGNELYDGQYTDEFVIISNENKNMKIIVNTDKFWIEYYKTFFVFKEEYLVLLSETSYKGEEQSITIYDKYLNKVKKIYGNIDKSIEDPIRFNRNNYINVGENYIIYSNISNNELVTNMLVEHNGSFYVKEVERNKLYE